MQATRNEREAAEALVPLPELHHARREARSEYRDAIEWDREAAVTMRRAIEMADTEEVTEERREAEARVMREETLEAIMGPEAKQAAEAAAVAKALVRVRREQANIAADELEVARKVKLEADAEAADAAEEVRWHRLEACTPIEGSRERPVPL
jgi:hypothetical protein